MKNALMIIGREKPLRKHYYTTRVPKIQATINTFVPSLNIVSNAKGEYDCKHSYFLSNNKNKHVLRFFRSIKVLQHPINIDSIVLVSGEMIQSVEELTKGLEMRFSSIFPNCSSLQSTSYFSEMNILELAEVVDRLPDSAPVGDGANLL